MGSEDRRRASAPASTGPLRRAAAAARWLRKGGRLVRSVVGRRPYLVNWQITDRCDFRCSTCLFWRERHEAAEELTLAQLRRAAEHLAPLAPLAICMSGGEPLLREDFPDVVRILAQDHFFSIITNGWHATPDLAERLYAAGLGDVRVSLDYASAERHDRQRGRTGAFERAVRALEIFRDARPDARHRVHALALLLDDNLRELEGVLRLAEGLGVSVELSLYSDKGGKLPRRVPKGPVARELLRLKEAHPRTLTTPARYLAQFDRALAGGIPGCQAGRTFFDVDARGRVSRCINELDAPVASVVDDAAERIVAALGRRADAEPCGRCWTSCRAWGEVMAGPIGFSRSAGDFVAAVRGR